jgi:hypothetical protein
VPSHFKPHDFREGVLDAVTYDKKGKEMVPCNFILFGNMSE